MSNRHLSRSIALQALFEWDFRAYADAALPEVVARDLQEFAPGAADDLFPRALVESVLAHRKVIDTIIEKAAPDWPLEKISIVDRNVLRIGLAELLFSDKKEVPAKVAINEAIELAKTFGGETSGRFVNGVLGTVYKEMGEPGKDEVSKPRGVRARPEEDIGQMAVEHHGGAVVYAIEGHETFVALVHDVFGYWTLSKGRMDADEDAREAVRRELFEELGIETQIEESLGVNEYTASHPDKGRFRKRVTYFLARAEKQDLKLKKTGGLDEARWFPLAALADLIMYDDIVPIVTKAVKLIAEKKQA